MTKSNFIKISIIILIILVLVFVFIFINKSSKEDVVLVDTVATSSVDRFSNTNTPVRNVNVISYEPGIEDMEYKKINKILAEWDIFKDPTMLKEALQLSSGTDNESLLEPWRSFISKNSSELIKIINTSSDIKKTSTDIYAVLDWYIYLSGEYENLSATKKQEILNQYNQLKKDLGIK